MSTVLRASSRQQLEMSGGVALCFRASGSDALGTPIIEASSDVIDVLAIPLQHNTAGSLDT